MSDVERWQALAETLALLAHVLCRAPDGSRVHGLPPPISRCIEERCDEMLRRWLPDPTQPLPGGEVQAAALARVQAAVILANGAPEKNLPAPGGEIVSAVSRLLLTQRTVLAAVWSKYWDKVK